jgi:hypothetical protein
MAAIWADIDAGKTHHHCVAIDESGRRLLSRRVANDEPELLQLLADVVALGDVVTWGIDLADGGAALATWLRNRHIVRPDRLAEIAVEAAERQHTTTCISGRPGNWTRRAWQICSGLHRRPRCFWMKSRNCWFWAILQGLGRG